MQCFFRRCFDRRLTVAQQKRASLRTPLLNYLATGLSHSFTNLEADEAADRDFITDFLGDF